MFRRKQSFSICLYKYLFKKSVEVKQNIRPWVCHFKCFFFLFKVSQLHFLNRNLISFQQGILFLLAVSVPNIGILHCFTNLQIFFKLSYLYRNFLFSNSGCMHVHNTFFMINVGIVICIRNLRQLVFALSFKKVIGLKPHQFWQLLHTDFSSSTFINRSFG